MCVPPTSSNSPSSSGPGSNHFPGSTVQLCVCTGERRAAGSPRPTSSACRLEGRRAKQEGPADHRGCSQLWEGRACRRSPQEITSQPLCCGGVSAHLLSHSTAFPPAASKSLPRASTGPTVLPEWGLTGRPSDNAGVPEGSGSPFRSGDLSLWAVSGIQGLERPAMLTVFLITPFEEC